MFYIFQYTLFQLFNETKKNCVKWLKINGQVVIHSIERDLYLNSM